MSVPATVGQSEPAVLCWRPSTRSSHYATLPGLSQQTINHIHKGRSPATAMYTPYLRIHEHVHACLRPHATCSPSSRHSLHFKRPRKTTSKDQNHHARHCLQWQPLDLAPLQLAMGCKYGAPSLGCGPAHHESLPSVDLSSARTRTHPHSLHHYTSTTSSSSTKGSVPSTGHTNVWQGLPTSQHPACLASVPVAAGHTRLPAAMCLHLITPLSATTLVATWLGPSPMLIPDSPLVSCASPAHTLRHQQLANSSCQNVTV